jgi:hypothetical protein
LSVRAAPPLPSRRASPPRAPASSGRLPASSTSSTPEPSAISARVAAQAVAVTSVAAFTPTATIASQAALLSRPIDSIAPCSTASSTWSLRAPVVRQPVPSGLVR